MEKPISHGSRVSIVYLAAGISSRFGGKVKQFETVGPNNESLIEISMDRAVKCGIKEIVFIVGDKTEKLFKEKFGNSYRGVPVNYALQSFNPGERDRPWGTADALVSAKGLIKNSFFICNSDDLYGVDSFSKMQNFLSKSADEDECACVGFELGNVLPEVGGVNRGVFSVDDNSFVTGLEERLNIEKNSLASMGLNEKTPISMNLFALKKKTVDLLEETLARFKKAHPKDRRIECYLPVELGNLIRDGKIRMKLFPTTDKWLGITNPGDELTVKKALAKK